MVTYNWFVDGSFLPASTTTNYATTFSSIGNHTVKLSVGKCRNYPCKAEITKTICIQPPATASFKVNALDSVVDCAPKNITITNQTPEGTCILHQHTHGKFRVILDNSTQQTNFTINTGIYG